MCSAWIFPLEAQKPGCNRAPLTLVLPIKVILLLHYGFQLAVWKTLFWFVHPANM
jgi:hypothetical protein